MTKAIGPAYRGSEHRLSDGLRPSGTMPPDETEILSRARVILQAGSNLTFEQFHELDQVFRAISPSQFADLTKDPLHQAGLRRYEALSWRQGSPAVTVIMLLSLIALFAVMLLALGQ